EGIRHQIIEQATDEAILLTTQNPRYVHPLLRGILLHYFIAYIHPFFDGNGRTARALFYFNSMRNNLDYVQLLSVSAYLKDHGFQYEKAFEKVLSNDLDVTYFIDFCLDSIHSALLAVSNKVKYLLKITELRENLNLTANQIGLLQRMALHKFRTINIEEYAQQINMSREIARQELKALTELGLVQESKLGKKLVYRINKSKLESNWL
ncbi:MAG: Fic family protein, partial [Bdellovibrionia bacterium]